MKNQSARIVGICFILAFISYGFGIELMSVTQDVQSSPIDIWSNRNKITIGLLLIALLHTLVVITLVSILYGILKSINHILSSLYFTFSIFSAFMLALGALFLTILIPLSSFYQNYVEINQTFFQAIVKLCSSLNFYAYTLGMCIWGIGGMILCKMLYQSKKIPSILSMVGLVGYSMFIIGNVLELFGCQVGVMFSIPGGIFEVVLSIWLLIKGFSSPTVTQTIVV